MSFRTNAVAVLAAGGLLTGVARGAEPAPPSGTPLRLDDAVRLALTRNERAKVADLNVVVADANVEKARAAFLPVLTAQGQDVQHAYDATDRNPNNIGQANLTVTQSILNLPAFPLYAQQRRLADAARAQSVEDKRSLAFSAATAFFAVLNAQDVLKAAQRQQDNAKANLADTQARAEAQLTSSNDVTRAHVDMASSAREVEIDRGALDNAFVQLAFMINAPVPSAVDPPVATLASAAKAVGPVDPLVRFALDHRPDLLVAKNQAVAAHDFAGEPLLRLAPTLNVQGQASATTNSATTGRWNDETVQATLTWTLYDQGVRYADKHARDAQASIADLNLQALARNVDAQVRGTAAVLAAAQAAFRVAQDAQVAAQQSVEETAILYRQGLAKAIELVDANDQRFSAEINYASAEFAMAQAYLSLRQAVGLDPLGAEVP
jgi:outer membrane protein TolC